MDGPYPTTEREIRVDWGAGDIIAVAAGAAFAFIDYDGAVSSGGNFHTTLGFFTEEQVFRWSMIVFWAYFVAIAFYRFRFVDRASKRALTILGALIALLIVQSSVRLFTKIGPAAFTIYEYRNLSLVLFVAVAVCNGSAQRFLRLFFKASSFVLGIRAAISVAKLLTGQQGYQADLGVNFTTFDGTLLAQESFALPLTIMFSEFDRAKGRRWQGRLWALFAICMAIDVLGSFRRHVYLRIIVMLAGAYLALAWRMKLKFLPHLIVVVLLCSGTIFAIFGRELVTERVASYSWEPSGGKMEFSNSFYLKGWEVQLEAFRNDPIFGVGLRNEDLTFFVGDQVVPIHTGFHVIWAQEGLAGIVVLIACFIWIPLRCFLGPKRHLASIERCMLGVFAAFMAFEGLFPFKDALVGNIKTCVGVGVITGFICRAVAKGFDGRSARTYFDWTFLRYTPPLRRRVSGRRYAQ